MFIVAVRRTFPKEIALTPKAFTSRTSSKKITKCDKNIVCGNNNSVFCKRLGDMETLHSHNGTKPLKVERKSQVLRKVSALPSTKLSAFHASLDELDKNIAYCQKLLDDRKHGETFMLYEGSIQSLYERYRLESKIILSFDQKIRLRSVRNYVPRLFYGDDTKKVADHKTKKALSMLEKMDERCQKRFEKIYGETFVTDIINQFKDYKFSAPLIRQQKIRYAESYWLFVG